jgi:hypothetical protein
VKHLSHPTQDSNSSLQVSKIFDLDGNFKDGMETKFRGWCQDYISFIKGDNPLTFPFRLPPPDSLIAQISTKDIYNKHILKKDRRSILTLCHSFLKGYQKEIVPLLKPMGAQIQSQIICTLPSNKQYLSNIFNISSNNEDGSYEYKSTPYFLAPSQAALITALIFESASCQVLNLLDAAALNAVFNTSSACSLSTLAPLIKALSSP